MRKRIPLQDSMRAFSLVELVIVVVIIGVIAAIAVPRITSAARGSNESSLRKNLATLRTAIDAYSGEHGGDFPGAKADGLSGGANSAAAFTSQLLKYSSPGGQVADVGDATHPFGPYLHRLPPAPVGANKGSTSIAIDTVNSPPLVTAGTEGWVYNPTTGQIIVNTDDPNEAGTLTYDEY